MEILFLGYEKTPVIDFLRGRGEEVVQTAEKINLEQISEIAPKCIISYGYRHIIKPDVVNYASGLIVPGIVNLHIAYLPWNRGADPNFWSWLEHTPKGYSIHYIDNGVDSGPILVQDKAEFSGEETLATSYAKLRLEIENLFMNFWKEISQGRIKPRKQEGEGSMHKVKDLDKYKFLMEEKGWDTAVREIEEYGRVNKLWKNE